MLAIAAALALLMGVTLGMLGGGGSILTVPILVYILEVPAKEAIATSLLVVGTTSIVALISHARAGNVRWKIGLTFGVFGMMGAYLGGLVAHYIPGWMLLAGFAALMLVTGLAMLRKRKGGESDEEAAQGPTSLPIFKIAAEGLVVGLVTGLVGAGGGFLVVPALTLMGGLRIKEAIGTSLLVIAMKSFAGFLGFAGHVDINFTLTGVFIGAAIVGTLGGAFFAQKVDAQKLRKGFAVFVLVMATVMVTQEVRKAMTPVEEATPATAETSPDAPTPTTTAH